MPTGVRILFPAPFLKMRYFLGIKVNVKDFNEIKRTISGFGRFKFVEPQNLHITLLFLGNKDEKDIIEYKEKLLNIKQEPFTMVFDSISWFKGMRIIMLKAYSNEYNNLVSNIGKILGFKPSHHPHITIARAKQIIDKAGLAKAIKGLKINNVVKEVNAFCLFSSELTSKGPEYKEIKRFSLA